MTENVAREFSEKSAARAKDTYGKAQAAAEETTKVMERTYSTASKGAVDFNLHLLEMAQANMNAAFDFARQLTRVKSPTESRAVDRAGAQAIRNVQRTNTATHDLAQKATSDAAQPLQAGRQDI